jgi:Cu/Ag efflux pump CusA
VIGPNLSEWSINRPQLVVFFMLVAVIAGTLVFLRLGRNEDPAFTFRTMVVQAAWPGATIEETLIVSTPRHITRSEVDVKHLFRSISAENIK